MKKRLTYGSLALLFLSLVGCKKEEVVPFDFFFRATFDGNEHNVLIERQENPNTLPWQNVLIDNYDDFSGCVFGTDTEYLQGSGFINYNPNIAGDPDTEFDYRIMHKYCVPDSIENFDKENLLDVGTHEYGNSGNAYNGIIINYRNGEYMYSTAFTPQPSTSQFEITNRLRVYTEGQWRFVTEGTFNCTLHNILGDSIVVTDGTFRFRTITD